MGLTPQERRCVELACRHLARRLGGEWSIPDGPTLEEQHRGGPTPPTPETVVTNGTVTAAVEVKRLTGDPTWQGYSQSVRSLKRSLAPTCGGYYYLHGSVDLRLPLGQRFLKTLRREIERVAPLLTVGDRAPVRVSRSARLRVSSASGPGTIFCSHADSTIRSFSPRLSGTYWLIDDDQWEHEFQTDDAREAFFDAIVAAIGPSPPVGDVEVRWDEEWVLERVDPGGREDGVWVTAVTAAVSVPLSVAETVEAMLDAGLGKFTRRWADLHVLVFESQWMWTNADRVREVLSEFDESDLEQLDLVLLVDGDHVAEVWSRRG